MKKKTNQYYLNLILLIEKNLLGRKKSKVTALEYFRSDAISIQVYYKILTNHYSDKITNFEQLYKEMTYGSRQTIKTILDFAVTSKFLIIGQNKNDKRKKDIYPSKLTITEFEKHYGDLRDKLNEL